MSNPFYTNRRWYPQPDPAHIPFSRSPYRGAPFYQPDPTREALRPNHHPVQHPPERTSGPKVVQIPVHFVGSKKIDRPGSAVKIQKVFRGFLVRKCLSKIKEVKVEVDEIAEKLLKGEVADLVRRDERERLRMNERLMSLLFKLDSVCGVDFGVRLCRKAVIRKAIALQERIDSIAAVDVEGNPGIVDQESDGSSNQSVDFDRNEETFDQETNRCSNRFDDPSNSKGNVEGSDECEERLGDESCAGGGDEMVEGEGSDGEAETDDVIIDGGVDREVKVSDQSNCADGCPGLVEEVLKGGINCGDESCVGGGDEMVEGEGSDVEAETDDVIIDGGVDREAKVSDQSNCADGCPGLVEEVLKGGINCGDDDKRSRELLEKIMEDNEKMMSMMARLCERNETQTRMINALTHRVELLEKAFVCDKMRRKKKAKGNAGCREN